MMKETEKHTSKWKYMLICYIKFTINNMCYTSFISINFIVNIIIYIYIKYVYVCIFSFQRAGKHLTAHHFVYLRKDNALV